MTRTVTTFFDWLALRDYDEALQHARVAVIKRLARGNVSFQNGDVLDDAAFAELRAIGDRAIAELRAQRNASGANGSKATRRAIGNHPHGMGQG